MNTPHDTTAPRSEGGRRARRWRGMPLQTVGKWGGGAVALVLLTIWLRSDDGDSKPLKFKGPAASFEGARNIVVRDHGRKVWEFSAAHIEVSPDQTHATATGIGNALLYRDGKPYLRLQAEELRLNQYTRDMQATGAVTAEGMNGITMHTTEAQWHQLQNTLETTGNVTATGPDGFSMRTNDAQWQRTSDQIVCPGAVNATFKGLNVDSKMVSYNARQSLLTCPQPLNVASARATLHGASGEADVKNKIVRFKGPMDIVIRAAALPAGLH